MTTHVSQAYNAEEAKILDTAAGLAIRSKKIRVMLKEPLALAVVARDGVAVLCTTHHLLVANAAGTAEVGFCALSNLTSLRLAPSDPEHATLVFQVGAEHTFQVQFKSARAAQQAQGEIQSRLH